MRFNWLFFKIRPYYRYKILKLCAHLITTMHPIWRTTRDHEWDNGVVFFCKAYYYFLIPASKNATIHNAMLHLLGGSRTEIGHLEWFPPVLGMCVGVINDLHCFVWIVYLLLDMYQIGKDKNDTYFWEEKSILLN